MSLEAELQSLKASVEVLTEAVIKLTAATSSKATDVKATSASAPAPAPAPEETGKKRGRPKKEEAAMKPADDFDDGDDEFGAEEPETPKNVSVEELRTKAFEVRDNKGADVAKEILLKYIPGGKVKIDAIAEADRPKCYAELVKALA